MKLFKIFATFIVVFAAEAVTVATKTPPIQVKFSTH